MAKFSVQLEALQLINCTITIEADSKEDAERIALDEKHAQGWCNNTDTAGWDSCGGEPRDVDVIDVQEY